MKSNSCLAIYDEKEVFKLVCGYCNGEKIWIENIFAIPKESDNYENKIKEALATIKKKVTNTILVLSRTNTTIKYLSLPTTNSEELYNMVEMQIPRQVPYTKEQVVWEYLPLGTTEDGYTKVMLIVVPKELILEKLHFLQNLGITPTKIELEPFGIGVLLNFLLTKGKLQSVGRESKSLGVIDLDSHKSTIVVLQGKTVTFARSIEIGAFHLTGKCPHPSGNGWISEWAQEIKRTINAFQREFSTQLDTIIFLGEKAKDYLVLLKGSYSHVEYIDIRDILKSPIEKEIENAYSFSAQFGIVVSKGEVIINLTPSEIISKLFSTQRKKSLVITSILIGTITIVTSLLIYNIFERKLRYIALLDQRLKESNPTAKELRIKREQLALIKKQLSHKNSALDILRELYLILPPKMTLDVFIYDEKRGVTLKGTSPTMSEVFELIPKLEASPYFENVTSRYATQRKIKGREVTDFQIDCEITPEGER